MRISHGLAALALAGFVFAAPQAASAAPMGSAFKPAVQQGIATSDVVEVGRRHYRRGWRRGHRHGWRHGGYRRYGYYGGRRYGHRRYYRGGPGISLHFGSRRGYGRHWW